MDFQIVSIIVDRCTVSKSRLCWHGGGTSEDSRHRRPLQLQWLTVSFWMEVRRLEDPLFTEEFREILKASWIKPIKTPPMAPHLNCIVERFIRSIKSECLNRMLIFGERHLEYVIKEYMEHYHTERAHQGMGNEIIEPPPPGQGKVVCQERLGGLLTFYRRAA